MRHNPDSPRVLHARTALRRAAIFETLTQLGARDPTLVGTIPLGVDLPESDLDLVCELPPALDRAEFAARLLDFASNQDVPDTPAQWRRAGAAGPDSAIVTSFLIPAPTGPELRFTVEIFADGQPVREQMAYRHFLIEEHLLRSGNAEQLRKAIRAFKLAGLSTEAAFCAACGIEVPDDSDAYQVLYEMSWKLE